MPLVEIAPYTYMSPEQIQIIRPATDFERLGRDCDPSCTTIILQNDLRLYIKGYPNEIMLKLYPDPNVKSWRKPEDKPEEKDVKCGR